MLALLDDLAFPSPGGSFASKLRRILCLDLECESYEAKVLTINMYIKQQDSEYQDKQNFNKYKNHYLYLQ